MAPPWLKLWPHLAVAIALRRCATLLKKLARAGLIDASTQAVKKQGGPARLVFRRRPGVRFNAAKLARRKPSDPPPIAIPKGVASEIAPNVEMQIRAWHRVRQGNLVRYITGVAARRDDDGVADDASAVTRRGGSRRLVQARARVSQIPRLETMVTPRRGHEGMGSKGRRMTAVRHSRAEVCSSPITGRFQGGSVLPVSARRRPEQVQHRV